VCGQLGQRSVEDRDLVRGVVGVGLPRPQQRGERLTGPAGAVVDEGEHGVEPEPAFEVRGRVLFFRVRTDQGGVQIDHDLPATTVVGEGRAMRPHPRPSMCPGGADRRDRLIRLLGQRVDQAADRRVGGHRTEQLGLGADHADVGQAVTTQRDRDRQIQHRLARVMDTAGRPPRRQPIREGLRQPADAGRGQQHRRTRRRDQRIATRLDTDTRTSRDNLHLRSAFPLGFLGPSTSPRIPCRTGTSVRYAPYSATTT
jgi:hypothetical protein